MDLGSTVGIYLILHRRSKIPHENQAKSNNVSMGFFIFQVFASSLLDGEEWDTLCKVKNERMISL